MYIVEKTIQKMKILVLMTIQNQLLVMKKILKKIYKICLIFVKVLKVYLLIGIKNKIK